MPKRKSVDPDFIRFLSMYESLDPDQQEDVLRLMKKWSDRKPHYKQITERLAKSHDEKQAHDNGEHSATSQRLKLALDRMPTAQAQLETIDQISRTLLKSVKQHDQIAVCTMLNDSIRDAHFEICELNNAYYKYQQTLVVNLLGGGACNAR